MSENRERIILISGMHRSGTSALAKVIAGTGFDPGQNLMPSGKDNKSGFYEDMEIYRLNNNILSDLYLNWNKTELLNLRKLKILFDFILSKYIEEAVDIIGRKLKSSKSIVIKDPRFSILMPFWNEVFRTFEDTDIKQFLTVRNPLDVSGSLLERNGMQKRPGIKLWFYYYYCFLEDAVYDTFVLNYEDLVLNPDLFSNKISKFISVEESLINKAINEAVNKNQYHHKSADSSIEDLTKEIIYVKKAYKILRSFNCETDTGKLKEYLNLFDTDQFNTSDCQNKDISYSSNLFLHPINDPASFRKLEVNHKQGLVKFEFEITEPRVFNSGNLFISDNPCFAEIEYIRVFNEDNVAENVDFTGNYFFRKDSYCFFQSSVPEIKFNLKAYGLVKKVEIRLFLEVNNEIYQDLMLAVQKFFIEKQNTLLSEKQTENQKEEIGRFYRNEKLTEDIEFIKHGFIDIFDTIKLTDARSGEILELKEILLNKLGQEQKTNRKLTKSIENLIRENSLINKKIEKEQQHLQELYADNRVKEERIGELTSIIKELEIKIRNLNDENTEKNAKAEYLWKVKQSNDQEILRLKDDIKKVKSSLSWILSYPVRFFGQLLNFILSPLGFLFKDVGFAIALLRREGLKKFLYRFLWYLRGKRLNEDIYLAVNNNKLKKESATIVDFEEEIILPSNHHPVVSIIIPVHNKWEYTYRCIKSICEQTKYSSYEIILADDNSSDDTRKATETIKNLKYFRNESSLHFVRNCNKAASIASGRYLHFLNNDVIVHGNWLSSLIEVFENYKDAGIAGSKLIYPDGRLQEAGGIIWNDATGWNYGKFDDPSKPEYNYLKETDYVSGASLMIKKELWEQLGGFDETFSPAYFEDTDLAFRVREKGYKVLYQPLSVITHFEGVSHGKDENKGLKKFQVENRKKFLNKYQNLLNEQHERNGKNVFTARERSSHKKQILVIDHYVPHYDKDAGSRSTFSYLKLFVKMGFNVKFIGDNFFKHEPYTTQLQQLGIEVLYGNYYKANVQKWVKDNGDFFDFIFAHRMHIAPKYFECLKVNTHAKIFYIGHDLQFLSSLRKYEITKDEAHFKDHEKFKQVENYIFNSVDGILPFSTYEAPYIRKMVPGKIVETIPVYFYNNCQKIPNDYDSRRDILFVGGFGHPPNVDALKWMVNEILPLVRKFLDGVKLIVVGSNPSDEIMALSTDDIIITGYVTDEQLKGYYSACKLAVLPLRFGAGVKGKLLEALYHCIPAVITPIAAEGVPEIENYALIADNPSDFAEKIRLVYTNKEIWEKYSDSGAELINKYYSEKAAEKILKNLLV